MDNRGIDTDPGYLNRQLRELKREIEALRSERRSAATTIGSGSLEVDGGDVIMRDTDGSIIFQLGTQNHGDRGLKINREDGTLALTIRKPFANTAQTIDLNDGEGYGLLQESGLGNGLGRPILPIPMTPVQATAGTLLAGPWGWQVPIATATFTSTHQVWYARQNQFGFFRLMISASDTTTAAEVRILDVGANNQLGAFLSGAWTGARAVGSTAFTEVNGPIGGIFLPGNPESQISLAVQVRRSAGAGTLQVALIESRGA